MYAVWDAIGFHDQQGAMTVGTALYLYYMAARTGYLCLALRGISSMHTRAHTRTDDHAYTHTHTCVHARAHIACSTWTTLPRERTICAWRWMLDVHTHTHTHAHTHTHTHTCTRALALDESSVMNVIRLSDAELLQANIAIHQQRRALCCGATVWAISALLFAALGAFSHFSRVEVSLHFASCRI